jgi:tetratricopeptide (TPR) repeat protein
LLTAAALGVMATPYIPVDDNTILERVPARSALEHLAPLRRALAARPEDLEAAEALARGYLDIGRRNGDPRFVAYAEAVLMPGLAQSRPPERLLVLQATALQYLHQFDAALGMLDRAIELEPLDGQAWLTRAALLELQGRYPDARRACARLTRAADAAIALTCLESVAGRNGQLAASYASLRAFSGMNPRTSAAVRSWTLAVLAEMAERLGDAEAAETALAAALGSAPDDPYLKAAYADLLLKLARPTEVMTLLGDGEAQDALLVRLAIAGKRAASPEAVRWAAMYEERMRAAERDRDYTHLREWGMFLLDVRGDPVAALRAAARNWSTQREPADLRLYVRAARLAGSSADQTVIEAWLTATQYEDRAVAELAVPTAATTP